MKCKHANVWVDPKDPKKADKIKAAVKKFKNKKRNKK